ncbi:hypothetical protein QBC36DRAFT_335264 [Triangularia setosa]|uniref:Uncharacterized protein n=1 Tax=Triangularia setosa TaxID=2587417 RepID=A0AAN6W3M4_9PEZI|nr:hypothetical protein QBC36DRAFT_335264 [Podospora setosa]
MPELVMDPRGSTKYERRLETASWHACNHRIWIEFMMWACQIQTTGFLSAVGIFVSLCRVLTKNHSVCRYVLRIGGTCLLGIICVMDSNLR